MLEIFNRDKYVIVELSRRNIKSQYRGSVLGVLWTVLNPLLNMAVMFLVFSSLFGGGDPYYALYLLTGNILFSALRNSTMQSLTSLRNNSGLLLRTKISPYVFPCSFTLTSIINFLFSLIALIPFMIWLSVQQGVNLFSYHLLFIVLMMPAFCLFEYGLGLILSCLYLFLRDVLHLYTVFLTLWTYLTPIFYKASSVSGNQLAYTAIKLNPMYYFVTYFREAVYMGAAGISSATDLVVESYLPRFDILGVLYICGILSTIIGIGAYLLMKKKIVMKL